MQQNQVVSFLKKNYVAVNLGCIVLFAIVTLCCLTSLLLLRSSQPQPVMPSVIEVRQLWEEFVKWRESVADKNLARIYFLELETYKQMGKLAEFEDLIIRYDNAVTAMNQLRARKLLGTYDSHAVVLTLEEIHRDVLNLDGYLGDHLCRYRSPREVVYEHYYFQNEDEKVKAEIVRLGNKLCDVHEKVKQGQSIINQRGL